MKCKDSKETQNRQEKVKPKSEGKGVSDEQGTIRVKGFSVYKEGIRKKN